MHAPPQQADSDEPPVPWLLRHALWVIPVVGASLITLCCGLPIALVVQNFEAFTKPQPPVEVSPAEVVQAHLAGVVELNRELGDELELDAVSQVRLPHPKRHLEQVNYTARGSRGQGQVVATVELQGDRWELLQVVVNYSNERPPYQWNRDHPVAAPDHLPTEAEVPGPDMNDTPIEPSPLPPIPPVRSRPGKE